jgi:N-acetylmuramic acid 6-phosphate etherase
VRVLAGEHTQAARAVAAVADALAAAVDAIVERFRQGGRLVYPGAGTAGRLGLLDAVECRPTFGTADGRVLALLAGGTDRAANRVAEGAEDDHQAGQDDVAACDLGPDDTLVGISASGRTPYVLGALRDEHGQDELARP